MELFLIVCCSIEAIIILLLFYMILRSNKRSAGIIFQAEQIKKRRIDIEDLDTNNTSNHYQLAMSDAMNSIKNNMQTFLESSKENVAVLSDAIDELSDGAKQNQQGSILINNNLEQVSEKVNQQLSLVGECQELIEENANDLSEIDSAAKDINITLEDTVKDCKSGISGLEICEANLDKVAKNLNRSNEILKEFSGRIDEVNQIGSFILEISESLNLLSLNASIEAARAGEAGKGFTVVASEMNGMAEKTSESMGSINNILESIVESSEEVANCISESVDVFNESIKEFNSVSDSFRAIDRKSASINNMMSDIFKKIEHINDNSKITRTRSNAAYAASEHIVDKTAEISEVSKKASDISTKMNDNVSALSNMLSGLKRLLKQYRTSVEPAGPCTSRKIKIGIFCMLDNEFWIGVKRGIVYAKNELEALGAEIRFCGYPNWNEVTMKEDFDAMIEEGFDGFLCPGFMARHEDLMEKAKNLGKKVFVFNCDSMDPSVRHAVFEPDTYMAGMVAAKEIVKGLKNKGSVIVLAGEMRISTNKTRCESFVNYIEKTTKLKVAEVVAIENLDEDDAYAKAMEAMKKYPDAKGMYITTGTPLGAARAIEDSGRDVKLVSFDHSKAIFDYIRKGIIFAAIGQDPFGQGYDPIVYMYNELLTGKPLESEHMKCRLNVVDANNVDSLVELM
ncbi:MAG: substrate-binding domain-containing protein [Lachnospiraceae bacterium]|nr:substrate-binding domain-containing protein [Lachnospiraceae bacterium]